jgi:hypothetical protein
MLFDNNGEEYAATLTLVSKQGVTASIGALLRYEAESRLLIHLLLGISRGERMDLHYKRPPSWGLTESPRSSVNVAWSGWMKKSVLSVMLTGGVL